MSKSAKSNNAAKGKRLTSHDIAAMWLFYQEKQSVVHVKRCCRKAGIAVSERTIRTYIKDGRPAQGVKSFEDRLAAINEQTRIVVDTHVVEQHQAAIGAWRKELDAGLPMLKELRAQAEGLLALEDEDGRRLQLDAEELRNAATAVKAVFDAHKRAAETHDLLKDLDGADKDGRDRFMLEHFEEFEPAEHEAFRDHGIWPERMGPAPAFISGAEGPN